MLEKSALLKAIRPALKSGWVGSSRGNRPDHSEAPGIGNAENRKRVLDRIQDPSTLGLASGAGERAIPRGTAPTLTLPKTFPLFASIEKTLSEPAAETKSVESSPLTSMAKGVARAIPSAGFCGGKGSRFRNSGLRASLPQSEPG